MIRRMLWGCLRTVLFFTVLLGIVVYFFIIRPIQKVFAAFQEPSVVGRYVPAQSGLLTRKQLETFIRIQRHIRGQLSSGYDGLAQNYKNLTSDRFNAGALVSAFQSAGDLVQDARTAQKQALVRERMTLSEYNWVKVEVYKSLGVDHVGIDLAEWSDRLNGSGVFSLFGLDYRVSSPPASKNARLVRPFQNELKATAPLALLGM